MTSYEKNRKKRLRIARQMNKYTVYTEFMHSKTVYLTFNLKQMIFQSLESEKSFSAQKRTKLVKNVFRTAKRRERKARKRLF